MALCEAAAYYKKQGKTLWDQMLAIYDKYGYYKDSVKSVTMKGIEGLAKIAQTMENLRANAPENIGPYKVLQARDYKLDTCKNMETGEVTPTGLPQSNVLYYDLEDGAWLCGCRKRIRPVQGTAQMKQYDVKISRMALSDMEQIYSYIADRLLESDTAMRQYDRIAEAIQSLNILPERCALVESEPERTQGLRQMLVDNYSVFYIVSEDAVSVARVLYSASDLVRRLRRMK